MGKIVIKKKLMNLAMKKKEAYVTRTVGLPMVDEKQLLERAADNSGIRRGVIYAAADAITNEVKNFLMNGHSVQIPLLGSFRFAVNAKAADTLTEAGAKQIYRRKIIYKCSKPIWRLLQTAQFEDWTEDDGNGGGTTPNP